MIAVLGESVAKGEPVLLNEGLEPSDGPVVGIEEDLCQTDHLGGGGGGRERERERDTLR